MTILFSTHLDETGTDGVSPYVIVAGGVALPEDWQRLEKRWDAFMTERQVDHFHNQDFEAGDGVFAGWGPLKKKNFAARLNKIISQHVGFTVAVAVERETHLKIKQELKGTKGFKEDSDAGLCFRILRFFVCRYIATEAPGSLVQFIVEEGPFSADMGTIYQDIVSSRNANYRPALHADMLAGFESTPKRKLRSLEAADYVAGRALADLKQGRFIDSARKDQLAMLATPEFLSDWHKGVIKEKEKRKSYGERRFKKRSASRG